MNNVASAIQIRIKMINFGGDPESGLRGCEYLQNRAFRSNFPGHFRLRRDVSGPAGSQGQRTLYVNAVTTTAFHKSLGFSALSADTSY